LGVPTGNLALEFNVSHSGDIGLAAVAWDRDVGVDVERIRAMEDMDGIAVRFFTSRESRVVLACQPETRAEAFFRCWTCKEAVMKAVGKGLSLPPQDVEVSVAASEPYRVFNVLGDTQTDAPWALHGLAPADGYTGAVACRGGVKTVRCWSWPGLPAGGP
jgi:4'-phosphopantetheinyl transferase